MELRDDPSSLAPDRVIVFEIAGTIADFFKAVARVDGLEFMAEYEADFSPDEDFAIKDTRKGETSEYRTDKTISGRFYLAMPDVQAFRQLLSLWGRWEKNLPLEQALLRSHTCLHNSTPCVLGGRSTVSLKRQCGSGRKKSLEPLIGQCARKLSYGFTKAPSGGGTAPKTFPPWLMQQADQSFTKSLSQKSHITVR